MLSFWIGSSQAGPLRLLPFVSSCAGCFCCKATLRIDSLCFESTVSSLLAHKQQVSCLKFCLLRFVLSMQAEACHSFFTVWKPRFGTCKYSKIRAIRAPLANEGWVEARCRARQSNGLSLAACWPSAMLLGHTALSLYHTPRVTALSLCGWLRCAVWAAAAVGAAANDQQSKASAMCCTMTTI